MSNNVADVANQALDAIGSELTIGDLEEGTRPAQVLLRAYGQCLRQMLRAAPWDFARKQAPLVLLADATGNTPNVGTLVPVPWVYEYEYPTDCMRARFVPVNQAAANATPSGNISLPSTQLASGLGIAACGDRIVPARFLVSNDFNYPPLLGQQISDIQGVSPIGRTVILTNVKQANLVYTAFLPYPSLWDALFRAAMVAYLASEVALALTKDKKLGLALRNQQIAIAKQKITQARVADGNEGWSNVDIIPDYIRARAAGVGRAGWGGANGNGAGILGGGWDSCTFANGDAY